MSSADCYHCGLPVPRNSHFVLSIRGEPREMCCPGCLAVATTIIEGGLESFYKFRSATAERPDQVDEEFTVWDLPDIQQDCVTNTADGEWSVRLAIQGITCAACTWLIEKHLSQLPGVRQVRVNGTTYRAEVIWNNQQITLSAILAALRHIGYRATPVTDETEIPGAKEEMRGYLLRMGLAGLAMMQTGMVAVALYAGGFQGIEERWENLLRLVSVFLVTPVVLYSAQPFFVSAWRSLKMNHLVMDVPVSVAILLAYLASLWATWRGGGDVYFDSIAMFTFFLLLGRFLEKRIRYRNVLTLYSANSLLPPTAVRLEGEKESTVPVKSLQVGDCVRVYAGQTIPCDGVVEAGVSQVEEAVLTGESYPVAKGPRDPVSAGTINGANPLRVTVTALGAETRLSTILRLVERVGMEKPHWVGLADKVSGWFVAAVLIIAGLVGTYWLLHDPEQALWITLSVLVVTCPCALSLATPTALSVATGALRNEGFLINRAHVLEVLSHVDQVVFDKTGTLTEGNLQLTGIHNASTVSKERVIEWVASLEQGSHHPIAQALASSSGVDVKHHRFVTGCGVTGEIEGKTLALGKPQWVREVMGLPRRTEEIESGKDIGARQGIEIGLASQGEWIATLVFDDQPRESAQQAVEELQQGDYSVALLSGDPSPGAQMIADQLNIADSRFGLQPEQKLKNIHHRQQQGHCVLMVGDGINDVPVLQSADVSVAMGQASDIARINSDAILLSGNLQGLASALELAVRTKRVIRQNISWAIGYNFLALPLAAMGWIPPWAAAIGMSASSLLVLINALRLDRQRKII